MVGRSVRRCGLGHGPPRSYGSTSWAGCCWPPRITNRNARTRLAFCRRLRAGRAGCRDITDLRRPTSGKLGPHGVGRGFRSVRLGGRRSWRSGEPWSEAGPVVTSQAGDGRRTTTPAVQQVLQDPGTFSSNPGAMFFGSDTGAIPLQVDPPEHSRYRKMLDPLFAPRRMAEREQDLHRSRQRPHRRLHRRGHCDFSTEFAVPFPSPCSCASWAFPWTGSTSSSSPRRG